MKISQKALLLSVFSLGLVNCGGSGGSDNSTPPPPAKNSPPTANAGADQSIDEQTDVTLAGSGTDSDGTIASYSWKQLSGEAITLSDTAIANPSFTAPVAKTAQNLEFELTVTDNDGASASDSVIVQVQPVNEVQLTLKGKVTDGPIANAEVLATVGELEFKATADGNGLYELLIEADEDLTTAEELVVLTAIGGAEQKEVKLLSALSSLAVLIDSAGDDKVLDASEEFGVNVTHLSSAILALVKEANQGVLPTSKQELEQILPNIDGEEALQMATAIKLVVDYAADNAEFALPSEAADTWELITNQSVLAAYLANSHKLDNRDDYLAARDDTLSDADVVAQTTTEVPEYYIYTRGTGYISGDEFIFNKDGTGSLKSLTAMTGFTWANADSLAMNFSPVVIAENFPSKDVNGVLQQVQQQTIYDDAVINVIKSSENADLVEYQLNSRYHYPNGEFPDEYFNTKSIRTLQKKVLPITAEEVVGELVLPVRAEQFTRRVTSITSFGEIYSDITENAVSIALSQDGTANAASAHLSAGVWNISNDGVLNVVFNDHRLKVRKIKDNYFVTELLSIDNDFLGLVTGVSAKREAKDQWTLDKVPGTYSLDWSFTDPLYSFSITLNEHNSGMQSSTRDMNENGVIDGNELIEEPLIWSLENDVVVVKRYRDINNAFCETPRSDCFVYNRREFDLYQIDGDKYYATNRHQFNFWPLWKNSLSEELIDFWTLDAIATRYWIKESASNNAKAKPLTQQQLFKQPRSTQLQLELSIEK